MDPATTFCPHLACAARGQIGQGNIGIHSGKDQRLLCTACHKTFRATKGTAFYRLRTPAETVALVLRRLAHGCPLQAIGVACGFDERTVAAWGSRAGRPGQAVQEPLVEQPRDLGQVQADESRVKTPGGIVWMALAMLLSRRLIERVKRCAAPRPLLVCSDGLVADIRALREPCREPGHTGHGGRPRLRRWRNILLAQVVKHYERRRVSETERRIIDGTPARVETLRRRSHGDGVINPADIERLNATLRARLAALTRRGRALARHPLTLQHGMYLSGTVYNFCPPHASLTHAGRGTTPAMAAGITDHCWTVQELLACHVPPLRWPPPKQRGRPAHALQRLIARWGADHG